MLNRTALHAAFAQAKKSAKKEVVDYYALLKQVWNELCLNQEFQSAVEEAESYFSLPSWNHTLDTYFSIKSNNDPYIILSVDGSQVYPDRHMLQVQHALIHIAGLVVKYDQQSDVHIFSYPFILNLYEQSFDAPKITAEWINLERDFLEYKKGYEEALRIKKETGIAPIVLLDGSLMWNHLGGLSQEERTFWFNRYQEICERLYEEKILYVSYISAPQNKDLIGLLQVQLCRFKRPNCKSCHENYDTFPCQSVTICSDRILIEAILPKQSWMHWFYTQKTKKLPYQKMLQPCFTYYHGEHEVARIEVPAWIAEDKIFSQKIISSIQDQVTKGFGYPVLLAEAHEQAVIKDFDREYFYKLSMQTNDLISKERYSNKSLKKRHMPC